MNAVHLVPSNKCTSPVSVSSNVEPIGTSVGFVPSERRTCRTAALWSVIGYDQAVAVAGRMIALVATASVP